MTVGQPMKRRCFDCHIEDVAVKLMAPGIGVRWYCTECEAARQERRERALQALNDARDALKALL